MRKKTYTTTEDTPITVREPAVAYGTMVAEPSSSTKWNPNVPFHCTQEEFSEHIHSIEQSIEQGEFMSLEEHQKRMDTWWKERFANRL